MSETVRIRIRGFYELHDQGSCSAENARTSEYEGRYGRIGSLHCVSFDGEDAGKVMIKIFEKESILKVEVLRRGPVRSGMCFEKGKCTAAGYRIPEGNIPMEVTTHELDFFQSPAQTSFGINIEYSLSSQGEAFTRNRIMIEVTPVAL